MSSAHMPSPAGNIYNLLLRKIFKLAAILGWETLTRQRAVGALLSQGRDNLCNLSVMWGRGRAGRPLLWD